MLFVAAMTAESLARWLVILVSSAMLLRRDVAHGQSQRPGSCFDNEYTIGEDAMDCGGPCEPCTHTPWNPEATADFPVVLRVPLLRPDGAERGQRAAVVAAQLDSGCVVYGDVDLGGSEGVTKIANDIAGEVAFVLGFPAARVQVVDGEVCMEKQDCQWHDAAAVLLIKGATSRWQARASTVLSEVLVPQLNAIVGTLSGAASTEADRSSWPHPSAATAAAEVRLLQLVDPQGIIRGVVCSGDHRATNCDGEMLYTEYVAAFTSVAAAIAGVALGRYAFEINVDAETKTRIRLLSKQLATRVVLTWTHVLVALRIWLVFPNRVAMQCDPKTSLEALDTASALMVCYFSITGISLAVGLTISCLSSSSWCVWRPRFVEVDWKSAGFTLLIVDWLLCAADLRTLEFHKREDKPEWAVVLRVSVAFRLIQSILVVAAYNCINSAVTIDPVSVIGLASACVEVLAWVFIGCWQCGRPDDVSSATMRGVYELPGVMGVDGASDGADSGSRTASQGGRDSDDAAGRDVAQPAAEANPEDSPDNATVKVELGEAAGQADKPNGRVSVELGAAEEKSAAEGDGPAPIEGDDDCEIGENGTSAAVRTPTPPEVTAPGDPASTRLPGDSAASSERSSQDRSEGSGDEEDGVSSTLLRLGEYAIDKAVVDTMGRQIARHGGGGGGGSAAGGAGGAAARPLQPEPVDPRAPSKPPSSEEEDQGRRTGSGTGSDESVGVRGSDDPDVAATDVSTLDVGDILRDVDVSSEPTSPTEFYATKVFTVLHALKESGRVGPDGSGWPIPQELAASLLQTTTAPWFGKQAWHLQCLQPVVRCLVKRDWFQSQARFHAAQSNPFACAIVRVALRLPCLAVQRCLPAHDASDVAVGEWGDLFRKVLSDAAACVTDDLLQPRQTEEFTEELLPSFQAYFVHVQSGWSGIPQKCKELPGWGKRVLPPHERIVKSAAYTRMLFHKDSS